MALWLMDFSLLPEEIGVVLGGHFGNVVVIVSMWSLSHICTPDLVVRWVSFLLPGRMRLTRRPVLRPPCGPRHND